MCTLHRAMYCLNDHLGDYKTKEAQFGGLTSERSGCNRCENKSTAVHSDLYCTVILCTKLLRELKNYQGIAI